jgi:hypothetical protein
MLSGTAAVRLERAAVALALAAFALFAAYEAWRASIPVATGDFLRTDFFAQWSFALFAHARPAAEIYDALALYGFQRDLAPALRQTFPFPYPPVYLLYLWPLGWLPVRAAYLLWMAATGALYLAASLPRGGGAAAKALAVLAPAVAVNIAYGQNGFLTAAALAGGVRLLGRRPVAAGVAFGFLLFKPQFGIFVPLALLAAGQWRTMAAAAATVAGLTAAGALAFGTAAWAAWLSVLPGHAAYVDTAVNGYFKPTLRGALLLGGADAALIAWMQYAVLALAALSVWAAFRRGGRDGDLRRAGTVLLAATFATAPFAFLYDLPALVPAAIALWRLRPAGASRLLDRAAAAAVLAVPAVMTLTTRLHWSGGAVLLGFLGYATWRALRPAAPAG